MTEPTIVIDLDKDMTFQYILRVGRRPNEFSTILTGHLLIEYLINRIIEAKCKHPQKIVKDSQNYTFSVKLQIVHEMGLLTDPIYNNIVKLNKIRNRLAHDLDFDVEEMDMTLFNDHGECINLKPKGKRNPRAFYLRMLVISTLNQLQSHMLINLRVKTRAEELFPFYKQG
jgi:hypothetical protein